MKGEYNSLDRWMIISVVLLIVLGLAVFGSQINILGAKTENPNSQSAISLAPDNIDLGNVSMKKGVVNAFFNLENTGKGDLIIRKLDTSCGCTSASVVYNGNEGPIFQMAGHGGAAPTNWDFRIPAGGKGQVKVYYDPTVHPDLRGPVTREISVYSNAQNGFTKKVTITLNQTD